MSWSEGPIPDTLGMPLEPAQPSAQERTRKRMRLSLFWRTFMLLALLLIGSSIGWYQLYRTQELEPRMAQSARQIASLVNLSRAALVHSDAIARLSLIRTMADEEHVRIVVHEPNDRYEPFNTNEFERRVTSQLLERLGSNTLVARSVNDQPGLWVGFSIEGDAYWLLMDPSRLRIWLGGGAWVLWLITLTLASLSGAALLAGLINQPLKQLSMAATRVREGDYLGTRLDEEAGSIEIREVNVGFNRMADQLSQIERDRAEMLAGLSHDLRTPLARLRLETELSVTDLEAREHMAADITQVDSIITKFLDYARPEATSITAIALRSTVEQAVFPFTARDDMSITVQVPDELAVQADAVELARVISNLLENARRYGQTPGTERAEVRIRAVQRDQWVTLRLRDKGPGVPTSMLPKLTRPFFRGDVARTSATGAGLGLSIVDKIVQGMDGSLHIGNSSSGGLVVEIRLHAAPCPAAPEPDRPG